MASTKSSSKTALQKAIKALEVVLTTENEALNAILRQGDRIIIPEHMTYRDASDALLRHTELMEEDSQTLMEFDAHPNDALVAFYNAVREQFGAMMGRSVETLFGLRPARSLNVAIGYGVTVNVPINETEIPGIPVTFNIVPNYDEDDEDGGDLKVVATYKRLYEPLVKRIEQAVRDHLRDNSIFKGKAIDSKWNFLNVGSFDLSRLVYSRAEQREIDAQILEPIRSTDSWVAGGSSLKRGILLYGPYGTGKTLTAMHTAKVCSENGWTFVSVIPGDDIVNALKFATRYQPAVVFFEDIDTETGGDRSASLNRILNQIDGVLAKDSQVMTILTTNRVEHINRSMLRPGRLDAVIKLGNMDTDQVKRMVHVLACDRSGKSLLNGDKFDDTELAEAARDYVPAFIAEAVTKAKAYAHVRARENGDGAEIHIATSDVIDALNGLRTQWELMKSEQVINRPDIDQALENVIDERIKPLAVDITRIKDYLLES